MSFGVNFYSFVVKDGCRNIHIDTDIHDVMMLLLELLRYQEEFHKEREYIHEQLTFSFETSASVTTRCHVD